MPYITSAYNNMELINFTGPVKVITGSATGGATSRATTAYPIADPTTVSYLYGPDGFINSLWPGRVYDSPVHLVVALLPREYKYPGYVSQRDVRNTVSSGRYDLLVSDWDPALESWPGDLLVRIQPDTDTEILSRLYTTSAIRDPLGHFYLWCRDRHADDRSIGYHSMPAASIELPSRPVEPVDDTLAAIKKKFGDPSQTSLEYLLSVLMEVNPTGTVERDTAATT